MSSAVPARPRLAAHAAARRHWVALGEASSASLARYVVVHDTRAGGLVRLEEREWRVLRHADGTRDLEGIRRAAARDGTSTSIAAIAAFLGELAAAGLLAEGEGDDAAAEADREGDEAIGEGAGDAGGTTMERRPVVSLPAYRLACDGRGSCCRLYATVLFSSEEEARARAHCPEVLEGGADASAAFTPEHGTTARGVHAAALVHGACAYLDAAHRCRIHVAGGPAAKPRGCQQFPAIFVDDGAQIVVTPALECACVLASAGGVDGEPLVPHGVVDASGLDRQAFVHRLPVDFPMCADAPPVPIGVAIAWTAAFRVALAERPLLEALAGAAASLAGASLEDAERAVRRAGDLDFGPAIRALTERLAQRTRGDASWRSPADLVRRTHAWMFDAVTALADPAFLAATWRTPADPTERFYVDTALFGHHLFLEETSLDVAIRDRIVRILLARAMRRVGPTPTEAESDGTSRYPLALVEAMMRGHGLVAYRDDGVSR